MSTDSDTTTLVLGATGKTGRRVIERLEEPGLAVGPRRGGGRARQAPVQGADWTRDFAGYARRTAATGIWRGAR